MMKTQSVILLFISLPLYLGCGSGPDDSPGSASHKKPTKPYLKTMSEEPADENSTYQFSHDPTKVPLSGEPLFDDDSKGVSIFDDPGVHHKVASERAKTASKALARLREGNKACRSGHLGKALNVWDEVIQKYTETPAWNMAILNSGRLLQITQRHAEAINVMKLLLANKNYERLDDNPIAFGQPIDTDDPLVPYLHCWNTDWHDAAMIVLACYEALGRLKEAREYAVLARDKHQCRGMCGVPFVSTHFLLNEKIAKFDNRLSGKPMIQDSDVESPLIQFKKQ